MTKILIVADNERLRELLVERLQRRGRTVVRADEAGGAVTGAKASQPDVILLDSPLRGDADWNTARALKFDAITREIPIVGLLANGSDEAQRAALQNGCDELHGKPLDFRKLLQQIDAAAKAPEPETSAEAAR